MVVAVTVESAETGQSVQGGQSVRGGRVPATGQATGSGQRRVRDLVALGDSTTVGIGDPRPGGGWRGFGPLLAEALGGPGEVRLANLSSSGARVHDVRQRQLAPAVALAADAVVLVAGMNDTMRADFDPARMYADLDSVFSALVASGALVLTVRFHDHAQVFRLPGALRRFLVARVNQLNEVIGAAAGKHGTRVLDLGHMPGVYDRRAWSVDRLHPSELGHRMLASGFADLISRAGFHVPHPVPLDARDAARHSNWDHAMWLVGKGIPWLWQRGRDLVPYSTGILMRDLAERAKARWQRRAPASEPFGISEEAEADLQQPA